MDLTDAAKVREYIEAEMELAFDLKNGLGAALEAKRGVQVRLGHQ